MGRRKWSKVVSDARQKIVSPLPVGVIATKLGLNSTSVQKLVDQGVLVFVNNERYSWTGPLPKRYIAIS